MVVAGASVVVGVGAAVVVVVAGASVVVGVGAAVVVVVAGESDAVLVEAALTSGGDDADVDGGGLEVPVSAGTDVDERLTEGTLDEPLPEPPHAAPTTANTMSTPAIRPIRGTPIAYITSFQQ